MPIGFNLRALRSTCFQSRSLQTTVRGWLDSYPCLCFRSTQWALPMLMSIPSLVLTASFPFSSASSQVSREDSGIPLTQEIIKVREWIPHIGPLTRVIHLNLFLDMVPSSSTNFTRAIFPRCVFWWRKQRRRVMADRASSKRKFLTHRRTSGRKSAQIYFVVKKEHGLSLIETKLKTFSW